MQAIAYYPHFCGVPSEPKAANRPVKIIMTSAMMAISMCAPFRPANKLRLIRIRGVVKLHSTYLAQKNLAVYVMVSIRNVVVGVSDTDVVV